MQVHNMLEEIPTDNGRVQKYIVGNIRLVRIKPEEIEVYKRNGEVIKFTKTEVLDEVAIAK